jgi:hypothetical protein
MYSGGERTMIKLQLQGEMIVGLPLEVSLDYQPKENEIVVESLPQISLEENQIAYLFYRNGKIEYEIKERG